MLRGPPSQSPFTPTPPTFLSNLIRGLWGSRRIPVDVGRLTVSCSPMSRNPGISSNKCRSPPYLGQHVMWYGVEGFHNVDEDDVCVASFHREECSSRAFSARRHLHQGDHISDCLLATKVADLLVFDEAVFQEVTEEALSNDYVQDLLCGGNQRDRAVGVGIVAFSTFMEHDSLY